MTVHKHAALMLQYAQDAAETDSPWERWEMSDNTENWYPCSTHPAWNEGSLYRRKKLVIKIGKFEFPKPMTDVPREGTEYFYLDFGDNGFMFNRSTWTNTDLDIHNIARNVAHLSHKDAQTHADVLNAICRGDIE